jgi:hypothetical protein
MFCTASAFSNGQSMQPQKNPQKACSWDIPAIFQSRAMQELCSLESGSDVLWLESAIYKE